MMTPEGIKNELKCMARHWRGWSLEEVANITLAYIEKLEEENMCMKIQMQGDCGICKHRHNATVRQDGPHFSDPCHSCIQKETRPNWEYEGLPEVKSR